MNKKLKELLREINDKTTKNNEYIVLTSSQNGIVSQQEYFNKEVAKNNIGYKIIRKGQFTYRSMSDTGYFYINLLKNYDIGIVSPAYPVFEIIDEEIIIPEYLELFFHSTYFLEQVKKLCKGSTRLSLKYKQLGSIEINIPSKEVQESIINGIDAIKNAIDNRVNSLNDCEKLITSKFNEMFGKEELKKVGDEFTVQTGGTPSKNEPSYWNNGSIPWIGSNMCTDSVIYENDGKFITEKGLKNSNAKIFPKGTVLIALIGATIGKTALLEFETTTNQNIAGILVTENKKYTPEYIFYCMRNNYYIFEKMGKGFNMANLKTIRNLTFPDADLNMQNQFSSYLKKIEEYRRNLQLDIQDLEILYNNKLQNAFKKTTN